MRAINTYRNGSTCRVGKKTQTAIYRELKFVGPRYNSHEIYVRSTDWNRTFTSAISVSLKFKKIF
uniref:Uncharacterized protein n=1 Tax=Meloidogyne enterolobii TaxID=390850 RepID=A0A6V7X2B5_MELEN|nr:unnamed protein product [Meloidogyne enterolobii]